MVQNIKTSSFKKFHAGLLANRQNRPPRQKKFVLEESKAVLPTEVMRTYYDATVIKALKKKTPFANLEE